jgi:hypothetical protein
MNKTLTEVELRNKFYLAPKNITYDELIELDNKYPNYPGLTLEQAGKLAATTKEEK